jgi:hypothetical protein
VERVEVEDATGNRWESASEGALRGSELWSCELPYYLPTNEVLKVRFTLAKTHDFSPEEIWTVKDVVLPKAGERIAVTNASLRREGFEMKLTAIRGLSRLPSSAPMLAADFELEPFADVAKNWRLAALVNVHAMDWSQFPERVKLKRKMSTLMGYPSANAGTKATFKVALTKAITIEFMARPRGEE